MILYIALALTFPQLLSCILILKGIRNKNYLSYKLPRRGVKPYFFEVLAKLGLVCSFIMTAIVIGFIIFDPEYEGAFLILSAGSVTWWIFLFIYLDCKNFYLQTTLGGMVWANFLGVLHYAPYKDIVKFTYKSRDSGDLDIELMWLVVKTAHGGTLRFDPVLTDAGLLMVHLAFRLQKGYWAQSDSPEDQQEIQEYLENEEETYGYLSQFSRCVIEDTSKGKPE